MKTLIVGAGALGSLFGGILFSNGEDVTLYDTNRAKIKKIQTEGLKLRDVVHTDEHGKPTEHRLMIRAVAELPVGTSPELVMMMVKSFDTEAAARMAARVKTTATFILTLQNGMGNVDKLIKYWDSSRILAGVTYQGALEVSPGEIMHTGDGVSSLSALDIGCYPNALRIANYLTDNGLMTETAPDFKLIAWKKLLVNSAINPLAAVYRLTNGELPLKAEVNLQMTEILKEGIRVAAAEGVKLEFEKTWTVVTETCRRTASNHCSMLSDVENGRRTEIEAINGAIVAAGVKHNIPTPVNKRMLDLVLAL